MSDLQTVKDSIAAFPLKWFVLPPTWVFHQFPRLRHTDHTGTSWSSQTFYLTLIQTKQNHIFCFMHWSQSDNVHQSKGHFVTSLRPKQEPRFCTLTASGKRRIYSSNVWISHRSLSDTRDREPHSRSGNINTHTWFAWDQSEKNIEIQPASPKWEQSLCE